MDGKTGLWDALCHVTSQKSERGKQNTGPGTSLEAKGLAWGHLACAQEGEGGGSASLHRALGAFLGTGRRYSY